MEQYHLNMRRQDESAEFKLREWTLKARMVSRENSKSRRFSSSYIRSLREESRSFGSNITISSTASSPGYNLREEIDPSTYSFTSALRALQARSVNTWDCLSPEGFALNSKWNEAEKYICNPLSGEVPMECLSAKTLSGRSFRSLTSRITMSAPLIYPSHSRFVQTTPSFSTYDNEAKLHNIIKVSEKKVGSMLTRDVGVQSTSSDLTWSSAPPACSPEAGERSPKSNASGGGNSPNSIPKSQSKQEEGEVKETIISDRKEETKRDDDEEEEEEIRKNAEDEEQRSNLKCFCSSRKVGCLSLRSLWMTRRRHGVRDKQRARGKNKKNIFPLPC